MAFLRNFNEKSRRILKAIVLMAKELGVHTLAEGTETKAQVDFLKQVGCEKIQGYYFGQPMSYEDIQIFVRTMSTARKRGGKNRSMIRRASSMS